MKIEEALKETGKAYLPDDAGCNYASEAGAFLRWWDIETKMSGRELYRTELFSNNWRPYHEVKEIRPEAAGELWKHESGLYGHTFEHPNGKIYFNNDDETQYVKEVKAVIHNKNGWTRLFPPVEDDSVERIELKNIEMESCFDDIIIKTSALDGGTVFNKIRGNVTIELPKGLTKHP